MSGRDWIQPGVKVAIYAPRRFGHASVQYDTVTRVLTRDIVLESGRRFSFPRYGQHPEERGAGRSYLPTPYLLPPDHLSVRNAETQGKESGMRSGIVRAAESFKDKPSVAQADALIAAVEAWKAMQP
jgi:hypothetical protein